MICHYTQAGETWYYCKKNDTTANVMRNLHQYVSFSIPINQTGTSEPWMKENPYIKATNERMDCSTKMIRTNIKKENWKGKTVPIKH